jgi:tellurite resistance protein
MTSSVRHIPTFGLGLVGAWTALAAGVQSDSVELRRGFLPDGTMHLLESTNVVSVIAGLLVLFAITMILSRAFSDHRREVRREILGLPEGPRFHAVDAMAHCVWRAGRIDLDRLHRALEIARNATDMDYSIDHIHEVALRADRLVGPMSFHHMRDRVGHDDRVMIFNAALSVLLADGPLSPGDRMILRTLSRGLGLRREELRDLGKLLGH